MKTIKVFIITTLVFFSLHVQAENHELKASAPSVVTTGEQFRLTFALMALSFYLFSNSIVFKKLNFSFAILFFLGSILGYSYGRSELNVKQNHNTAIIFSPSVTVRSSPDEAGSELFYLHEGTKVSVEDELGDWREIKIEDGNQGWIKKLELEMI